MPLAAVAVGVAAVQWPVVSSAAGVNGNNHDAGSGPQAIGQAGIAGQARNDRLVNDNPVFVSSSIPDVIPGLTRDPVSTSSTPGSQTTVNTPVQSQFDASNQALAQQIRAQAATNSGATKNTSGSSNAAASSPPVIPDEIRDPESGIAGQARNDSGQSATTFTTAAGVVLAYPRARGETANGLEDTQLRFAQSVLLANDSTDNTPGNPGQPALTITSVFAPTHGSVSLQTNAAGLTEVVFNPDANYHGQASFSYTVTDQYGLQSQATTTLTIAAVNDAPQTTGETANGGEDNVLYFNTADLLANDTDVDTATDGQTLSISGIAASSNGVATLTGGGRIQFIPSANFHGIASFTYLVSDGNGAATPAKVLIQIAATNDIPVATGELVTSTEDTSITFPQAQLLANDSDADTATDGQTLSISAVSSATNGSVQLLANGNIQFTPNANFHGPAQFTYTVSDSNGGTATANVNLTVLGVNDAPVATGEAVNGAIEDTLLAIAAASLLVNDTDVDTVTDGQVLRIQSVSAISNATHGTVSLVTLPNGQQQINFVPDANYHGPVQFSYTVTDGNGGTSVAIATLNVAAVNDAPVANTDSSATNEDTALLFNPADLLGNDTDADSTTDADTLSVASVGNAANGTVRMLANGQIEFIPHANFHGTAGFDYTTRDSQGATSISRMTVMVAAVNDAPVATGEAVNGAIEDTTLAIAAASLLANDTDVDTATDGQVLSIQSVSAITGATHGTVSLTTLANGQQQINFVPDANYHGPVQFSYTVTDGNGGTSTAIATLNVAAVNDVPVATGETATTNEDTAITFTQAELLANDSDSDTATDGQTLLISAVSGASNGTVTLLANGDIRFIPSANYHGQAQFSYTVTDSNGGTASANVNLTVLAVNDAPVAVGDVLTLAEDTTSIITQAELLGNDTDNDTVTDGDTLTITRVFGAQHCTAVLNPDGTVTLDPEANYHGNARFSYEVTDSQGATSITIVIAGVNATNDAPVAVSDSASTLEDVALVLSQSDLLANDSDADIATDGDVLRVASVGNAAHGQVRMLANGQIEFLADANFHGIAGFDYTTSDSFGATSTARVTVNVGAVNDAPVAMGETLSAANANVAGGALGLEDITLAIAASALLANDTDVDTATDGQVLSIQSVSAISGATHGTLNLVTLPNGQQQVNFVPDSNYHGPVQFGYVVTDGNGGTSTAIASFNVAAVNDLPVATGESASTNEDTSITFTQAALLANDSDVDVATDGQTLFISAVSGASNGTVSLMVDGKKVSNTSFKSAFTPSNTAQTQQIRAQKASEIIVIGFTSPIHGTTWQQVSPSANASHYRLTA